MKNDFQKKYGPWAVITGASDGIGKSIAFELARKGINTVLVARRVHLLKEIGTQIQKEFKVEVKIVEADLSNPHSTQKIADETQNLDVGLLAAVAGFGTSGLFIDSKIENEIEMLQVNCQAVVSQCHYFGDLFVKRKSGGIILVSSIVAFQGVPMSAHYSATKAFIQSLAEGLHFELKPFRVDVLATAPGPVDTGFARRAQLTMENAADPTNIAISTLNALGSTITVRPGFLAKFLGYSLSGLNRWGRIKVMSFIMSGMTKK